MAADLKVVEFSRPHLGDIPGHLRRLADAIEAGEHGDVNTLFAIMPRDGHHPCVFGWGDVDGRNDPIFQFELAKLWMLNSMVDRQ